MPCISMCRTVPAVFALLLLFAGVAPVLPVQQPADLLVNHFVKIDSLFAATAGKVTLADFDSGQVYTAFRDELHQYPEVYALIAVDKKGKTGTAVCFERLGSAFKGSVAHQEWFRKAMKSKTAGFGRFCKVNGRVCLVWCRPCLRKGMLGMTENRGAVVALVNVAECLKSFSADFGRPFELVLAENVFYHSDDWRDDCPYREARLELADGLTFTIRSAALTADNGGDGPITDDQAVMPSLPARAGRPQPIARAAAPGMVDGLLLPASVLFGIAGLALVWRRRKNLGPLVRRLSPLKKDHTFAAMRFEDRALARRQVMEFLRGEIRSRIEKYEIASIENDTRERLRRELRKRLRDEIADTESETLRQEVYAEEKASLRCALQREIDEAERPAMEREARARLRACIEQEVRERESSRLRAEVMKEARRKMAAPIEAITLVEEQSVAPHLTVSTSFGEHLRPSHPLESEAVVSLARTVASLKKERCKTPHFRLDNAQTALMIDYLEKIAQRLTKNLQHQKEQDGDRHLPVSSIDIAMAFEKPTESGHEQVMAAPVDQAFPVDPADLRTGTDE
ncbi:MAG: hypothetical protein JXA71_19155 [Chitinispirillaceae bacterium]|nr:hypothetical protein [Chitinispirillaceae bacterium]